MTVHDLHGRWDEECQTYAMLCTHALRGVVLHPRKIVILGVHHGGLVGQVPADST